MKKSVIALIVLIMLVGIVGVVPNKLDASAQQATVAVATMTVGAGNISETWTATHIAQQDFQHGFMFWISTKKSMWALIKANPGDMSGEWKVLPDTFTNGEAEFDPALNPADPKLYQPHRGFGKLWRDPQTGLRDALGYGTTPEFELTTPMSYLSAPGVGRYLLITLGQQVLALYETTPGTPGGRWELVGQIEAGPSVIKGSTPVPTAAATGTAEASFGPVAVPTMAATP